MKEEITISRKDAEWIRDLISDLTDTTGCDHETGHCICEDRIILSMLNDKLAGRIE